jgi:predicted nucleic acid-binding protein
VIILDTNVVSEAMKPEAKPSVIAWLDAQDADQLFLTTITVAELLFGIGSAPSGRRKDTLAAAFEGLVELYEDRILAFDLDAARAFAGIAVNARQAGQSLPLADGYIAAIAAVRGFAIATRDTGPFAAAGVPVINPWTA